MNSNGLARRYVKLTPEERFQLLMAAGGRGDDVEQDRLAKSGLRIKVSMQDHAPFAFAFDGIARLVYLELLEEAHRYLDSFERAQDFSETEPDCEELESPAQAHEGTQRSIRHDYLRLALASGFVLRTKSEGWKLFCKRRNLPPFALWESLPGYDRLRKALAMCKRAAFLAEGFLRWMNGNRSEGEPELTRVPYTVEEISDATEAAFRERVRWWGG